MTLPIIIRVNNKTVLQSGFSGAITVGLLSVTVSQKTGMELNETEIIISFLNDGLNYISYEAYNSITSSASEMFNTFYNKIKLTPKEFKLYHDLLSQYEPKSSQVLLQSNSIPSSNNTRPIYSSPLPHFYYPKVFLGSVPILIYPLMIITYQLIEIITNIINSIYTNFYSWFEKMWTKANFKTTAGQKRGYDVYNNENKINEYSKKGKYESSTANKGGSSAAAGGNNNDEGNNDDNNDKKRIHHVMMKNRTANIY